MQPMIEVGVVPASNRYDPSEEHVPATLVELVLGNTEFINTHGTQARDVDEYPHHFREIMDDVLPGESSIGYSDHDSELSIGSSNSSNEVSIQIQVSGAMVPSDSIVAIASFKIPIINGIHSFKLTMADGSEISTFEPADWPIEVVDQWRSATEDDRWQLPASIKISNSYNYIKDGNDIWLFVTDSGQFGHLFNGSTSHSNMRLQRFLVAGGNLQVSIARQEGSECMGPISAVSSDATVVPTIKRIDVYFSRQGVTGFHFVEQGSVGLVSMSSTCSSFELQDFGSPDAECIIELCALQDDLRLYALQVLTNRGRASTLTLPDGWKRTFRFTTLPTASAQVVCNELRRNLEQKLEVHSKLMVAAFLHCIMIATFLFRSWSFTDGIQCCQDCEKVVTLEYT